MNTTCLTQPLGQIAHSSSVKIISSRPDPFAGLKGHDYIRARGLNKPVTRVQTSAHDIIIVHLAGQI